jgi:hypothetical protein
VVTVPEGSVTVTWYSVKSALLICLKTDVRFFCLGCLRFGGIRFYMFSPLNLPAALPARGGRLFLPARGGRLFFARPDGIFNPISLFVFRVYLWRFRVHNEVGAGEIFLTAAGCSGRISALDMCRQ